MKPSPTHAALRPSGLRAIAEGLFYEGGQYSWRERCRFAQEALNVAAYKIETLQAELDRCPARSISGFAEFLIKHRLLDPLAFHDPEGYDNFATLNRIHDAVWEATGQPAPDVAHQAPE